ncbi:MAG TPA: AarF/UbiB family protein [Thermoanaerobaculia bacterium]|nr:AarF/UbiB family protein [Thermoanaerobaculia bacterium]
MNRRESTRARRSAAGPIEAGERFAVESCLASFGLLDRPRPAIGPAAEEPFGRRLRGALEELGPVWAAFGRYLASRIDLLAAADCLELAAIPEWVAPLSLAAFRCRIAAELGRPDEAVFAAIEAEPCESRLLVQGHRARLAGGQPVVVRLARSESLEAVATELPRLALLAGACRRQGWRDGLLAEALADFQRAQRDGADLGATAEALGLLGIDAEGFGLLAAPAVRPELLSSRLLTVDDPGGADLALATDAWDGSRERRALARLICVAWLRQALGGRVFPVELAAAGARVLDGGRLVWMAGSFARPPLADRANLRGFLIAMAAREPDDACSYLLREMTREPGAEAPDAVGAAEEQLRLLLRQVVPYRDGAWTAAGTSLAEHVFVFARQARACGFRPRLQLVAFYRGLASVAVAARRLAPEDDVLLEALQEVRVLAGFSQVREAMSPPWGEAWGRYAMLMSELPRKLDELLTLATEAAATGAPGTVGSWEPGAGRRAAPPRRREQGSQLLLAGVLMALAALALLLHDFVQTAGAAGGRQHLAAMLFLGIGGALLWMLARAR